jgi:hypothetical protein
MLARDHSLYRPFREILLELHERYRRPLFIAETGAENEARVPWLAYINTEALAAETPERTSKAFVFTRSSIIRAGTTNAIATTVCGITRTNWASGKFTSH